MADITDLLIELFSFFFLIYSGFFVISLILGYLVSQDYFRKREERLFNLKELVTDELLERIPVSVVIPAYNEADCIQDTIYSLLEDNYPCLNIYVVDDGSKDGMSRMLINRYNLNAIENDYIERINTEKVQSIYSNCIGNKTITLLVKQNGGKSDAINCGLNLSRDEYCLILDADTKVEKGAIKIMVSIFLENPETIAAGGAIGNSHRNEQEYNHLSVFQKSLIYFQRLEYLRTFYIIRIMFNRINANPIMSGAFTMFKTEILKQINGFKRNTIGEDMEITMRLHAFFSAMRKKYQIAYVPEAKCYTEFPFIYSDFVKQRIRWHIGLLQSLKNHIYMIANTDYSWIGVITGTVIMLYEVLSPFIELTGLVFLLYLGLFHFGNIGPIIKVMITFVIFIVIQQAILVKALKNHGIERISVREQILFIFVSLSEILFFHPFNMIIKIIAIIKIRKSQFSWDHITRIKGDKRNKTVKTV